VESLVTHHRNTISILEEVENWGSEWPDMWCIQLANQDFQSHMQLRILNLGEDSPQCRQIARTCPKGSPGALRREASGINTSNAVTPLAKKLAIPPNSTSSL